MADEQNVDINPVTFARSDGLRVDVHPSILASRSCLTAASELTGE